MDVLVLSGREVERLLDVRVLLAATADAFRDLSDERVVAPGRNELAMPAGSLLICMPGRRAQGPAVVKNVTLFETNPARGLPAHLATIAVHDSETGACRAFLDGTYITAIRTSAAAAVACDALARRDARSLAIIGAGVQGEHHLRTFPLVRRFDDIRIFSREDADAERLAASEPAATAFTDAEAAVRGADVVALTTNAAEPAIDPAWVAPGAHVSSVGYHPPGGELPQELAAAPALFVETRLAFAPAPVGCAELQGRDAMSATEVGEVLLGRRPGRGGDDEITVYKAMGHVAEDIAAVELVLEAARREGAGTTVAL